jgi:hypothetical protein
MELIKDMNFGADLLTTEYTLQVHCFANNHHMWRSNKFNSFSLAVHILHVTVALFEFLWIVPVTIYKIWIWSINMPKLKGN